MFAIRDNKCFRCESKTLYTFKRCFECNMMICVDCLTQCLHCTMYICKFSRCQKAHEIKDYCCSCNNPLENGSAYHKCNNCLGFACGKCWFLCGDRGSWCEKCACPHAVKCDCGIKTTCNKFYEKCDICDQQSYHTTLERLYCCSVGSRNKFKFIRICCRPQCKNILINHPTSSFSSESHGGPKGHDPSGSGCYQLISNPKYYETDLIKCTNCNFEYCPKHYFLLHKSSDIPLCKKGCYHSVITLNTRDNNPNI
jgi:hypothetical protein